MRVDGNGAHRVGPSAVELTRLGRPFLTRAQREAMARIGAELGAMKRRHAGERSALRARQRLEAREMQRRVKAGRA